MIRQVLKRHGGNNSLVNEVNHVTRIGIGTLVRRSNAKTEDEVEEMEGDTNSLIVRDLAMHSEPDPTEVMRVEGDESWGLMTKEDVKVPVTIF